MRVWRRVLISLVLVLATAVNAIQIATVSAAQITVRSLTLQNGVTDGGSKPGGVVNHKFTFTIPTTGNIGSIKFLYCDAASGPCVTPTGLVTTAATMGTETGNVTGFSMTNTTNGAPYIHRTAASITGPEIVGYQLMAITNPTTTNESFFVRISTYASEDVTGSPTDAGVVTASTATQIVLTGIMPESLIFCTGSTIGVNGINIPDCSSVGSGDIAFDKLFSPSDTAVASSQMSASTNALYGYVITVSGPTLTSGSSTIPAMTAATTSVQGTGQFGMNLKLNATPVVGAEISLPSNGTDLRGKPLAGYDTADTFKFNSGDTIADSSFNVAGPSSGQIYTVSYMVNVAGNQLAGTYTTTLTYVCTSTF